MPEFIDLIGCASIACGIAYLLHDPCVWMVRVGFPAFMRGWREGEAGRECPSSGTIARDVASIDVTYTLSGGYHASVPAADQRIVFRGGPADGREMTCHPDTFCMNVPTDPGVVPFNILTYFRSYDVDYQGRFIFHLGDMALRPKLRPH